MSNEEIMEFLVRYMHDHINQACSKSESKEATIDVYHMADDFIEDTKYQWWRMIVKNDAFNKIYILRFTYSINDKIAHVELYEASTGRYYDLRKETL